MSVMAQHKSRAEWLADELDEIAPLVHQSSMARIIKAAADHLRGQDAVGDRESDATRTEVA